MLISKEFLKKLNFFLIIIDCNIREILNNNVREKNKLYRKENHILEQRFTNNIIQNHINSNIFIYLILDKLKALKHFWSISLLVISTQ